MADTTLNGAIGADDTDITVDAALSADRDGDILIQIEDEFLLVERRAMDLNPQVRRGIHGTVAATHADAEDVIVVVPVVATGDEPAAPSAALPFSVVDGVLIAVLPDEDPEVVGALWADVGGVVTVSAG